MITFLLLLFIDSAVSGVIVLEGECVPVVVAMGVCVAGGVETIGVDPAAWPELTFTCRLDSSTASKSEPGIVPNMCRSSLFHRLSGAPEIYQLLPLSATIIP